MADRETCAILGLKRELKTARAGMREAKEQAARWRKVCTTLRGLAGLDDTQFRNLLQAESLPAE